MEEFVLVFFWKHLRQFEIVDEILKLPEVKEIHIGLNDLSLGYGKKFMFELLADGTVERLCRKFREKEIDYGLEELQHWEKECCHRSIL